MVLVSMRDNLSQEKTGVWKVIPLLDFPVFSIHDPCHIEGYQYDSSGIGGKNRLTGTRLNDEYNCQSGDSIQDF